MKYLTKEWYRKSNLTDLHFNLEIIEEAADQDDELFQSLYEEAEQKFIEEEQAEYDFDPREFLDEDSFDQESDLLDFLAEEDFIEQLIENFDNRDPFSEEKAKKLFAEIYESSLVTAKEQLPPEIYSQIADPRIFALGFCTDAVYNLVRAFSVGNNRETMQVLKDYEDAMRLQDIPRQLQQRFRFHDCQITGWLSQGKDLVLTLDTEAAFTSDNRVIFLDVTVLLDENIVSLYWTCDELYKTNHGYEVHILCDGDRTAELNLLCSDIRIEEI